MHTVQLMPLPLTVSCFSKIWIGFTFLVPAQCACVFMLYITTITFSVILFELYDNNDAGDKKFVANCFRLTGCITMRLVENMHTR